MKKEQEITGGDYLALGLFAFLGVGMELVVLGVEGLVFPNPLTEMTSAQHIIHWIATCIVWGLFAVLLARYAKRHYNFCILGQRQKVPVIQWALAIVLVVACVVANAWSWGTLKILGELALKDGLLFLFQYLYYVFEVALILSVIVYGQKAGELWFNIKKVPWGGILLGLTWGLMHIFTKGSWEPMISGLAYGCIYLLVKKQSKYAYPLILLAFVL